MSRVYLVEKCWDYSERCFTLGLFRDYVTALNNAIKEVGTISKVLHNGMLCVDKWCLEFIVIREAEVR